ncbi:MAG: hypothetical protein K940chlam3_01709, partial [Chlamydiae bacterium]|nr:hypothetical protein [Chlamydiota bacterium]
MTSSHLKNLITLFPQENYPYHSRVLQDGQDSKDRQDKIL